MTVSSPAKDLLPRLQRSATRAFTPLQREMNHFLDELGDGWNTFTELHILPPMDAVETNEGLEMTLELPGLSQDEVTLTVDDNVLVVSGDKKADHNTSDRNCRALERSYGAFRRSIRLPSTVDAAKATASMTNGVLKIVAPHRPDNKSKTIAIRSA